ncbi:TIGR03862 family flavoprotein [Acetobacter orientalis]|uniref:TIGR03862 family flavoprotein n=1 Tax=Acetobacter orientalis TaxID=146474 RepID=UPI0039EAF052
MQEGVTRPARVCVIGGGPAGLAAAEVLSVAGCAVQVVERMPSYGRKLLMAGRGGLNISHSEAADRLLTRYGSAAPWLAPALAAWTTQDIRDWMAGLGQDSFVGSSGRVFPTVMKASPLLRAWLERLRSQGVVLHTRTEWTGWNPQGHPIFTPTQEGASLPPELAPPYVPDAIVLALGGASWPRLGSTGAWVPVVQGQGVEVAQLQPSNCGFQVRWSDTLRVRFAGTPLKPVALSFAGRTVRGEVVVTATGLEGGALYALSAALRAHVAAQGSATLLLDLRPDLTEQVLAARLASVRPRESLSNRLRKALRLPPLAVALLHEAGPVPTTPQALAARLKALPITLHQPQPLVRAISTAGGVMHTACTPTFMLSAKPGVFVAGEMLDWEAPTGGYLLHGCLATGRAAAKGVLQWLQHPHA